MTCVTCAVASHPLLTKGNPNVEQPNPKTPLETLVKQYLGVRDDIAALTEAYEISHTALKEKFEGIADAILSVCNEVGADTLKTSAGTISRRVRKRFWTTDWPSMYECINKHDAPYLLEQRIHMSNMTQFLQDNPEAYPPGLQVDSKYVIQIRKPNQKD